MENPINDVKLTAGSVTGWEVHIQSPGAGENTWPQHLLGYLLPSAYVFYHVY